MRARPVPPASASPGGIRTHAARFGEHSQEIASELGYDDEAIAELVAKGAGLGLDEVSRARSFRSGDEKEAVLLAFLEAVLATDGRPSAHLGEEAREAGWSDEQLLEAVAHTALSEFQSLISNAAALPQDQTDPSILPQAA